MVNVPPETWNQISLRMVDWAIALKMIDTARYSKITHNFS